LKEEATTTNDNGNSSYRYTLGLRPKHPNQFWKIVSYDSTTADQPQSQPQPPPQHPPPQQHTSTTRNNRVVPWDFPIRLTVAGTDPRAGQPDSSEVQVLSVTTTKTDNDNQTGTAAGWYVVDPNNNKQGGMMNNEGLRLLRPSSSSSSSSSSSTAPSSPSPSSSTTTTTAVIHPLAVSSIPDICDKGAYLYYSPQRWKPPQNKTITNQHNNNNHHSNNNNNNNNNVVGDGHRCAIIEFHFWITQGVMYFRAANALLPFTLGIPIMTLDRHFFVPQLGVVANLFESFSARWGCIKYYMATAADVGEGCALNMESFLRGVTDHEEHRVIHERPDLVYIDMQDEVDTEVPDLVRDESQVYRFFFSW
jgi:hypothetical protein